MILHLLCMRKNDNRKVFNDRKNLSATMLHTSELHIAGQCVFVILGCRSITNCMSVYDYERSYKSDIDT